MSEKAKRPWRSPIEKLEEWLFKQRRKDPFDVFDREADIARKFKEHVAKCKCPCCEGNTTLEVTKFERGHKGWEAEIECAACTNRIVVSSHTTFMHPLNSKGRARE